MRRYLLWGFRTRHLIYVVGEQTVGAFLLLAAVIVAVVGARMSGLWVPTFGAWAALAASALLGLVGGLSMRNDYPPAKRATLRRLGMRGFDEAFLVALISLPVAVEVAAFVCIISSAPPVLGIPAACAYLFLALMTYALSQRLPGCRVMSLRHHVRMPARSERSRRFQAIWMERRASRHASEIVSISAVMLLTAVLTTLITGSTAFASYVAGFVMASLLSAEVLRGMGDERARAVCSRYRISHEELFDVCATKVASCIALIIILTGIFAIATEGAVTESMLALLWVPYFFTVSHWSCRAYLAHGFVGCPGMGMQLLITLTCALPLISLFVLRTIVVRLEERP